MRLAGLFCLFVFFSGTSLGANRLEPKNTYAVVVGVLSWEQKSLTSYSADNRQDVALHEQLLKMGVPKENTTLLLDQAATRDAITSAVKAIARRADENSTLVIYYAGHGMMSGKEGIFACYDLRTRKMKETGWRHTELTKQIQEHFRGDKVLLFADCCFSGALETVAANLSKSGVSAASLTSATSINTSTYNWTYTVSLIDALSGASIVDANHDGQVTISEAALDVKQTMTHYENQRSGFSIYRLKDDFQLVSTSKEDVPRNTSDDELKIRGKFVQAKYKNKWQAARILDARGPKAPNQRPQEVLVEFQDYSKRPQVWIKSIAVRPIQVDPKLKDFPKPLEEQAALKKASLDGKLKVLLHKIKAENDFHLYGEFHDFGNWSGSSYREHGNLKPGRWVYAFPHWYIWESDAKPIEALQAIVMIADDPRVDPPAIQLAPAKNAAIPSWDTKQMIGPPDTHVAGDNVTAWASQSQDDDKVWIELTYKNEMTPSAIHVYETYNPGAIYQISAFVDGEEKRIWKGKDPTSANAAMGISKIKVNTDLKFKKIRIYLDSPAVPGWNEIDAVAMIDKNQKPHWAIDAAANSNYSGRTPEIPFVDPFQTPEDRLRERKIKLLSEIEARKNAVRRLNDAIEAENKTITKLYRQLDALK